MSSDPTRSAAVAPGTLTTLVVLFALPLFLRLWPIEHGLPATSYVPDTHVVRNALGMARDGTLAPPSGRYSTYPYLLSYLLLPVYAGEYALGRATGEWGGTAEFAERALEDPAVVHLPARILFALLCALTPWVVFRATRAAGLGRGAWVSAWLVATGLLHLHFSVQERPWGVLALFFALAAWPAALYAREGRRRHLVLSGLAAGLAFATHQAGLAALGLPGLAWLCGPLGYRGRDLGRRVTDGVACVALAAVVGVLVGHPYVFVHGAPEASSFASVQDVDLAVGGQAIRFGLRQASLVRLSRALAGYDPAILVLAALGLWGSLAMRGTRPVAIFVLAWLAFFLTNQNDHVRYLLPAAVLLAWPAGLAAELLLARRFGIVLLVPLLTLPLVQALRLTWVLRNPDTRATASDILERLPGIAPGTRFAIDRYGPDVALDRASLERLARWRELGSRERHRLELFAAGVGPRDGLGLDAVPLADLFQFDERARTYALAPGPARDPALASCADDAGAVLAALGVTHLLVVDRRPGDGLPSSLLDDTPSADGSPKPRPARIGGEAFVVDPAGSDGPPYEALLPTDMDFALTAIWQVQSPGPRIVLAPLAR